MACGATAHRFSHLNDDGGPLDLTTELGPMIDDKAAKRTES